MPGDVYLGFPGVGGVMNSGTADYVRIRQQPTALPKTSDPRLAALEAALSSRGFAVQRVADMDGWLAYHAAFVACIAAALYRCGTDPVRLAADRTTLTLMCQAISEAFAALRTSGTAGARATSPCCTARCSDRLPSATGHGPCARRWASCALPRTADTPRQRCGPLATTWQSGSPAHPPWQSCSAPNANRDRPPSAEQAAASCTASTRELKLTPTRRPLTGLRRLQPPCRPELVSPTPVHSHSWHWPRAGRAILPTHADIQSLQRMTDCFPDTPRPWAATPRRAWAGRARSPVAGSNGVPSRAASLRMPRNASTTVLVANDLECSRPRTAQRTRH
jgi:hypothetical protein